MRQLADDGMREGIGLFLQSVSNGKCVTVGRLFTWEPLMAGFVTRFRSVTAPLSPKTTRRRAAGEETCCAITTAARLRRSSNASHATLNAVRLPSNTDFTTYGRWRSRASNQLCRTSRSASCITMPAASICAFVNRLAARRSRATTASRMARCSANEMDW